MSEIKDQYLTRKSIGLSETLPVKIVQFGEGNFLRAFVDYAIQQLNTATDFNAGVAVVQPIDRGMVDMLNKQDGLYTLFLKGVQQGKEIQIKELITTIVKGINPYTDFDQYLDLAKEPELKFIISNTTEAGIEFLESDSPNMQPPASFPAKLTLLMYKRFEHFKGEADKGLTVIPCELINHNADTLKAYILNYAKAWQLDPDFVTWINNHCSFHNTLVDRIVPGYPKDQIESYNAQLPYKDQLIVAAEAFFLWVIEGDDRLKQKLPFDSTDLDVKIVQDMQPYRTRKVRILNGAHTAMVPFSILYGNTTVKETVDDAFTGTFVNKAIFEEINETLPMKKEELDAFAEAILDRFRNPFIKHQLSDIALNSLSKFKVRVLPSLLEFVKKYGRLPRNLTFAMACLIRFYKGDWKGNSLPVKDSEHVVAAFSKIWKSDNFNQIATDVLGTTSFWDEDLNQIPGLTDAITFGLEEIEANGVEIGFNNFNHKY